MNRSLHVKREFDWEAFIKMLGAKQLRQRLQTLDLPSFLPPMVPRPVYGRTCRHQNLLAPSWCLKLYAFACDVQEISCAGHMDSYESLLGLRPQLKAKLRV